MAESSESFSAMYRIACMREYPGVARGICATMTHLFEFAPHGIQMEAADIDFNARQQFMVTILRISFKLAARTGDVEYRSRILEAAQECGITSRELDFDRAIREAHRYGQFEMESYLIAKLGT